MEVVKMDVAQSSSNNSKDVDESLYSRQLYVFGHEAQKKLASSNVLLVGLNGLGIETAKNIILAGVASVTLYDNTLVTYEDLSAQFYLTEQDLGQPRSTTSGKKLMELNPYVDVSIHTADPLTTDIISQHSVVILIDQSWEMQCQIAEYCHLKNIAVLIGDVKGVFASIFCDFGQDFIVSDATGEENVTCVIGNIILDPTANSDNNNGDRHTKQVIISVLEENRHNLEVGDMILLHGLYNSDGSEHVLNNTHTTVLAIKDSYTFTANITAMNIASPAMDGIIDTTNNSSNSSMMTVTSAASTNIPNQQQQLYSSGGYLTPVKQPVTLHFKSLVESVSDVGINFNCDVMKMESAPILHLAWRTLYKFKEQSPDNSLPQPGNTVHAQTFYDLAVSLNRTAMSGGSGGVWSVSEEEVKSKESEKLLKRFALCCRGVVSPICALIGGILGQEVLKASSGKFTPIQQWYYYNGIDALSEHPLPMDEVTPTASSSVTTGMNDAIPTPHHRYDGQVMVWGKTVQQRLGATNAFLVGAGAIGCEMLKNWAMMGMSTDGGVTYVTDMDNIERSNLSRQFLFRNSDINQLKSVTAVKAIHAMNAKFQCVAYDDKVGVETEDKFGDDYFDKLDIVCAALDNVEARLYLDQRCLMYHKPMFESGTLGTKGHTQVVIPHKTEHYGATRDPPEKSIPLCTLKSFPNKIEHTLQWAREWFEEIFKQTPDNVNRYVSDTQEFKNHLQTQSNTKLDTLQKLQEFFETKPATYSDCIKWARCVYEDLFVNKIQQLLYMLPINKIGADGTPFWSGAKLPPSVIPFDTQDVLHQEFLIALADLRATVYQLPSMNMGNGHGQGGNISSIVVDGKNVPQSLATILENVVLPVFQPNSNMKISLTEEEAAAEKNKQQSSSSSSSSNTTSSSSSNGEYMDVDSTCESIWRSLPSVDSLNSSAASGTSGSGLYRVQAIDFDKDIDSHMRVVAALANMRARNYRIPVADLHKARGIAGKIIPAIATTTAMVTGMICMEMMKYIQNRDTPVEKYQNTFTNLALPLFTSAEPDPPKPQVTIVKGKEWKWNQWDRVEINDNYHMTLLQLIGYIEDKFEAELAMLSAGVSILYSSFSNPKKAAERKKMTLRDVYESVTKKIIPPSQKYLIFELILNDMESGEEMEVPYLRLKLRD